MKSKGKITRSTDDSENKSDWHAAESFYFLYDVSPSSAASSLRYQSLPPEPADWFYSINGTEGYGPVTASAVEQMIQSGQLTGNSYVWQEGQNARFIKNEPKFSGGGKSTLVSSPNNSETINLGGEMTGTSESVESGQVLHSSAASLGWLMFLKITVLLLSIIAQGLVLLGWSGFSVSHALAVDDAAVLFVTLFIILVWTGLYALQFKTFLCFWKYHADLYRTVATGRASDLIQANHSQFLFWKWLGITVIAKLSVAVLSILAMMIASGWFLGYGRTGNGI